MRIIHLESSSYIGSFFFFL